MQLTKRVKILGAVAVLIGIYIVATWPDADGTSASSASPARSSARASDTTSAAAAAARPAARRDVSSTSGPDASALMARLSRRVADGKAAPALFKPQSWYVPPPPPPPAPYVAPPPPPPPTAPPLPFSVMGSYARPGDSTVYFLTRGDRVFDVRVGDTIDHTYSVDGASGGQLQLTYLPLKIQQTLAIGGS
jgi:hypothetical protein